jgi:hypothetical protein
MLIEVLVAWKYDSACTLTPPLTTELFSVHGFPGGTTTSRFQTTPVRVPVHRMVVVVDATADVAESAAAAITAHPIGKMSLLTVPPFFVRLCVWGVFPGHER